MHTLVTMATQVAHADVPVLITGPNGAGKEVLADIIQANSAVRSGPYLKVNLGALPQDLIEWPISDAVAIRQTARDEQLAAWRLAADELPDQA